MAGFQQFVMVSRNTFIKQTLRLAGADASGLTEADLSATLDQMLAAKRAGQTYEHCGLPVWVAGSATAECPRCFPYMTGETDCSKDYEVEE